MFRSRNTNEKTEYNKKIEKYLIDRIKTLFNAIKKDEIHADLAGIDDKLSAKLHALGEVDLAEDIKHRNYQQRPKKSSFGNAIMMYFGYAFMGLVFSFVAIAVVYPGQIKDFIYDRGIGVKEVSPAISLAPSKTGDEGFVKADTDFSLKVNRTVDSDLKEGIVISPPVPFDVKVEQNADNASNVTIIPKDTLNSGQKYIVSIKQGTKLNSNEVLKDDVSWSVEVEPDINFVSVSPADKSTDIPLDGDVIFVLNRSDLSADNFAKFFSIEPQVDGKFEKIGKSIIFKPSDNFLANTTYKVLWSAGSESTKLSLPEESLDITFTTSDKTSQSGSNQQGATYFEGSKYEQLTSDKLASLLFLGSNNGNTNLSLYSVRPEDFSKSIKARYEDFSEVLASASTLESKTISGVTRYSYEYRIKNDEKSNVLILVAQSEKDQKQAFKVFFPSENFVLTRVEDGMLKGWVVNRQEIKPASNVLVFAYDSDPNLGSSTTDIDDTGYFEIPVREKLLIMSDNKSINIVNLNLKQQDINYYINDSSLGDFTGYFYNVSLENSNLNNLNDSDQVKISTDKPTYVSPATVEVKFDPQNDTKYRAEITRESANDSFVASREVVKTADLYGRDALILTDLKPGKYFASLSTDQGKSFIVKEKLVFEVYTKMSSASVEKAVLSDSVNPKFILYISDLTSSMALYSLDMKTLLVDSTPMISSSDSALRSTMADCSMAFSPRKTLTGRVCFR